MKDFKIIGYSRSGSDWRLPSSYHTKDVANTIHTLTGRGWNTDQFVLEYDNMKDFKILGHNGGEKKFSDIRYKEQDICKSLGTFSGTETRGGTFVVEREKNMKKNDLSRAESMAKAHGGRIRKLTPRECFRLMNVDDSNIDKIQAAGISESQQYKLAGNSIVVNVLAEIFRKLFVDTDPEHGHQLELF